MLCLQLRNGATKLECNIAYRTTVKWLQSLEHFDFTYLRFSDT